MDHGLMQSIPAASSTPQPTITCTPDSVPLELRERNQWVVWRYVVRGGKPTKVPINPKTGREADSTSPPTWSSFADAVHSLGGGSTFAGIGFVFSTDDPFTGIDLDDCIVDGDLVPAAQQIVDAFGTYTEVSPSGNGVKMIVRGRKPEGARCKSKAIEGFKETEVYDAKRFFTLTGRRLPGTPDIISDGQIALDKLCLRLWPPKPRRNVAEPARAATAIPDYQSLLARMFSSKHGDAIRRLWDGDTSDHGGDHSAADLALCNHLAFWTGRDRDRMDRLFRGSGLYRTKWEREDYRDWTLIKAIEDCTEVFGSKPRRGAGVPAAQGEQRNQPMDGDALPAIFLGVEEWVAIQKTIEALARDPDLYQRGNVLVRVLREREANDGVVRPEGSATIAQVPVANLRERMTRYASFESMTKNGEIVPARPAAWLVSGVDARGEWSGIRHLLGVSDAPILRADGTVWQTPGYDSETRVLFDPPAGVDFPSIHPDVDADDASAALDALLEIVEDFRFESDDHRAAWLAAMLTPLARFAFSGPSPLFLIDANVRGAGKGLLTQTIGQVVMGREMPVSSYAHDSEEMRKKITSLAIAGDRMVLLDNLEGNFGNDALDRALTSTRWKDRILGKSEQVDLPLLPVWYGTGNNVQVAADTTRRIIHIRLDVLEENPEDRTDFKHPDLIAWLKQERGRLLGAALTILSAYIRAGMPKQNVTPYGSFEGWSRLVREAVVWVGLPDPCLTRVRLAESADTIADALAQLIDAWVAIDAHGCGVVVSELLARLYPAEMQYQPRDDASIAMRAAIENATGCPPGKTPSNRQVGNKLKTFRRRVVDGRFLDTDGTKTKHGVRWQIYSAVSTAGDNLTAR